jgi:hypothetical protein
MGSAASLPRYGDWLHDCLCGAVEGHEKAVARRVGFLAHDRGVEVQDIAPGDLRRDNKYVVYVCWADSRYDTSTWKEDVIAYHRRKDAVTRGWHG